MDAEVASVAFDRLPNELVAYILSFLDEPSPFDQKQYESPTKILAHNSSHSYGAGPSDQVEDFQGSIHSASRVCHLWRQCLLPLLFRHVIWKFQRLERPFSGQNALTDVPELAFLRFLRNANLTRHVESLVIVIDYAKVEIGEDKMHHLNWGIQPAHRPASTRDEPLGLDADPRVWDNNWLWQVLFENLDLLTISLVSSPAILATLLGRPIDLSGAWIFCQKFHILTLSRPKLPAHEMSPHTVITIPPFNPPSPESPPRTVPCTLFSIRAWDSILVNEGSSVKVYATYEYFNHLPPSLLPGLLDAHDPSMTQFLNNIRSFSYIAIFPFSSHINDTLIPHIPAIERFYVQIVPRTLSFADEEYRYPAMDISDLWMERNTTYAYLVRAIFAPPPLHPWRNLHTFESGDSADREAWEHAVKYVVFTAGTTWKVAGEGMFVRRSEKRGGLPLPTLN